MIFNQKYFVAFNRILNFNEIRCIQSKSFAGLKNLRVLSLHGNQLSTIPAGTFTELLSLTHM